MIDLAPNNPYSLLLSGPVIVAAGCDIKGLDRSEIGAIATRTATLHTRRDATPSFAPAPAGVVFSALPAIGIRTLLKEESRRWERSPMPVLASLRGDAVELAEMALMLESVEGLAALLLEAEDDVGAAIGAARRQTQRPILAQLAHSADLIGLASAALAAGADGLVALAPPRAAGQPTVNGLLLGPAVFPLTLQALHDLREAVAAPIVALGGVATAPLAQAALQAGATAVMVDAARWGDPLAPARIAHELSESRSSEANQPP